MLKRKQKDNFAVSSHKRTVYFIYKSGLRVPLFNFNRDACKNKQLHYKSLDLFNFSYLDLKNDKMPLYYDLWINIFSVVIIAKNSLYEELET